MRLELILICNMSQIYSRTEDEPKSEQDVVLSKSWSVSIGDIFQNDGMRLDARHFDPEPERLVQELRNSGIEFQPLSSLATVELRSQFTRIWAKDRANGLPYMNATDLLSLMALGIPSGGPRYLSYATETDVKRLVVREGNLLITCSGTIGRVFYVPGRLDGWAATHDLIRIVPHDTTVTGFLYSYLGTRVAQSQILSHTHGGQIDHVTDVQVGGCLVPRLSDCQVKEISDKVIGALHAREQAMDYLMNAWTMR